MRVDDGQLLLAPTDLSNFVACEHLTQLEVGAARGEIAKPEFENPYGDLLARKGEEHEAAFLESLRAAGRHVAEIGLGEDGDFDAGSRRTAEAMRDGAEFVYQAVLVRDGWRGLADFLERVDVPSELGDWSYQALDTKLARHPRPSHALQLCFYSDALGHIQGLVPDAAYVVLGTSERVGVRIADVAAYYRRLCSRFEEAVGARPQTAPYPCDHCDVCDFRSLCRERWEQEDHLVRVANIRRGQIERLKTVDIGTLTALAESPADLAVQKMAAQTFATLHEQAELQLIRARTGSLKFRMLELEEGRGLARLPQPSAGDLVLDFEGHPFFEPARGLEFLFGVLAADETEPAYTAVWAHDREGERRALEWFVDLAHERLERHPDMHVYHFASYEPSALKRLMGEYATREAEVDELLRRQVFVDLHTVVRQALRAGVSSYSLKELEALYGFERKAQIGAGDEAVVAYERYLATGEEGELAEIAAYNEEDCRATLALRDWLVGLRPSPLPWPEPVAHKEVEEEKRAVLVAREALRLVLIDGAESGSPRWLAGELLEYHRREARPGWWAYFDRLAKTPEELVEESEAIGCLEPDPDVEPVPRKKSLVHTLRFPVQDHKLGPGEARDPATERDYEILEIDDRAGTLQLVRGPKWANEPLPRALIAGGPYPDWDQRDALARLGRSILEDDGRYRALKAILDREYPRFHGREPGGPIHTIDLAEQKALALSLDESCLFVQGPPGSGKTWTGARLIVHLLDQGKRVGIAAQSHKAIHNLLDEVEKVAEEEGVEFHGLKKATDGPESRYDGRQIHSETLVDAFLSEAIHLVAGTAWLFAREKLDSTLDYLVIDEAGQVSLADALAMGTSARNVILLGDPLQLAQVTQGTHPDDTGVSVLEHLLDGDPTIPEERGLFLERSFRMHPDVCEFVSEVVYAGRLYSDDSAARRTTALGTGIRHLPVEHEGNRSASDEEVTRIAAEIERMGGAVFRDSDGTERALGEEDFMVVAPYNAQVNRLARGLPEGVRIGTVDKFQGQEAPVVFFSMATSSGEDVPRNLAFLFSRNRLNVAISRAQCLAVLVCSPRLLEARCQSIEEMQLVNALCRLVEVAEAQAGAG